MGTSGEHGMETSSNYSQQNDCKIHDPSDRNDTTNGVNNFYDCEYILRQNRKRSIEQADQLPSINFSHTPQRKNSEQINKLSEGNQNKQGTLSYFYNSLIFNKQNNESSLHKQIFTSSSNKQQHQH